MPRVDPARLKAEGEFRLNVVEPGFCARTIVEPGTRLYDPMLGWTEPDGAVVLSDHGPQADPDNWDPEGGSGGLFRLHPDDRIEVIIEPGSFRGMPFNPRPAPASFGDGQWEGHVFMTSQRVAGARGARSQHVIIRHAPGATTPELFAEIPNHGTIGDGIPGWLMIGGFGPEGSRWEGKYYCNSLMNYVVYEVTADGKARPYLSLDDQNAPESLSPFFVFWAGPTWGEYAGQMMIAGAAGGHHGDGVAKTWDSTFYAYDGQSIDVVLKSGNLGLAMCEMAPPEFGPFGGHTFYVEFGDFNQVHADNGDHVLFVDDRGELTEWGEATLPYNERIMRIDHEGNTHVFAEHLQAGWNEIRFSGDRMLLSCLRKSFSSGQFHEPDGSLHEIRAVG
jgi:hypothetical protein